MQQKENNKIKLAGVITKECTFNHELYGEKFYDFNLKVLRLSGNDDELIITISERLIDINELKIGTKLKVEGQLRSYNNHNNKEENRLKLTVFAKSIVILSEEDINSNKIYLNGYICKEPTHRVTPLGREICDIIIAVNRSYNKSDYIPLITWGRNANFCKNLKVGDNIQIWGRMQSRNYEKVLSEDKVIKRTAYEVSVSKIKVGEENNKE